MSRYAHANKSIPRRLGCSKNQSTRRTSLGQSTLQKVQNQPSKKRKRRPLGSPDNRILSSVNLSKADSIVSLQGVPSEFQEPQYITGCSEKDDRTGFQCDVHHMPLTCNDTQEMYVRHIYCPNSETNTPVKILTSHPSKW
jgi:hypothetical protein